MYLEDNCGFAYGILGQYLRENSWKQNFPMHQNYLSIVLSFWD